MSTDKIVEDYLTELDKKRIAESVFRDQLESILKDENDLHRFMSNHGYRIVYQMVDEQLDDGIAETLKKKVTEIISGMTFFNVFKKPDAWDRDNNSAYHILRESVLSQKDEIDKVVSETISKSPKSALRNIVNDGIKEWVIKKLTNS